jgi:hypothetical protein
MTAKGKTMLKCPLCKEESVICIVNTTYETEIEDNIIVFGNEIDYTINCYQCSCCQNEGWDDLSEEDIINCNK